MKNFFVKPFLLLQCTEKTKKVILKVYLTEIEMNRIHIKIANYFSSFRTTKNISIYFTLLLTL